MSREPGPLPVTSMQAGLLTESLLTDRAGVNVEQVVCHLDEEVSAEHLAQAWNLVQQRHPVLRSRFVRADSGEICRSPSPDRLEPLQVDESPLGLEAFLVADRSEPFDLEGGSVMRMRLLASRTDRATLVWTFHHALLDGRSFAIVVRELFDLYDDLRAGAKPRPAEVRPSFDEHVEAALATDVHAARQHYRQVFAGYEGPPAAPPRSRHHDAPLRDFVHDEVVRTLPAQMVRLLEKRAEAAGGTLGTALLATWAVLVSRWTNNDDVVLGSTRSGRHLVPESESIVGCLITATVIRTRIGATDTVDDLIGSIRAQQVAARAHEHLPLTDVHALTDLGREVPLLATNVMFEVGTFDSRVRRDRPDWSHRRFEVREATSFPMSLAAYLDDDLELHLEHDKAIYEPAVVDKIATHLVCLLEAIARSGSDTRVDDLSMFTEASRTRLLVERNPTRPDVASSSAATFIERFISEAEARPGRIALRPLGDDTAVSYGELDRRSERLAAHLVEMGARPGEPIGICLPRSVDFITALIAVIKAGGAYLPLDPTYPVEALNHMVQDSRAGLIVTNSGLIGMVAETDAESLVLDGLDLSGEIHQRVAVSPRSVDDPSYVIYTSGSTGRPKGVAVSRRALANHLDSVEIEFGLTGDDRVLQFASLSFDVSVEEILPTLALGAELHLRTDEMARSVDELLDAVASHEITVLNLPSAFWHVLVDHLEHTGARIPPSVRLMIVGGEKVSRHAYASWARIEPHLRFVNAYGPTETTITCTTFDPAGRHDPASDEELPIGRPLPHARAYVLGIDGRWLMPDGQEGELWIGGQGVALGYLGRPDLTAERFRNDPFSWEPGARMYRTGDRARWRRDGELEYLGRIDRQIKVRGFRIEPQEIEAVLEQHESVRHAHVALRASDEGPSLLVAWVVERDEGHHVDPAVLISTVRTVLPDHKVPEAVAVVDKLPITPGGKVDVDALPSPPSNRSPESDPGPEDLPATPTERAVAEQFCAVLDRKAPVGLQDSFFDLGGNSVLAVRLIGRIEHETGVRIPYGSLHRAPSVRGVASTLHGLRGEGSGTETFHHLTPIQPQGTRPPMYALHVLGTNECYYRPLSEHLGTDQPIFGLSFADPGVDTPTGVEEVAALYVEEIERHQPTGPLSLAAVSMGAYVAYEAAQQLRRRGREVAALVVLDAAGPGGRPQLPWSKKVPVHLRLVAGSPRERVTEMFRNWAERILGILAVTRLRLSRRRGSAPAPETWMRSFVEANARAAEQYRAEPYQGPMVAIRAADEPFDSPEWKASALGWSGVAVGGIEVIDVPGMHLTMLGEPHIAALATALESVLPRGPAGS